jgi:hypothetical protein
MVFTQIRPVWVGHLGTRPKNPKSLCVGSYTTLFCGNFVLALLATLLEKHFYELHWKTIVLDCFLYSFDWP